jgi:hypothetical protein
MVLRALVIFLPVFTKIRQIYPKDYQFRPQGSTVYRKQSSFCGFLMRNVTICDSFVIQKLRAKDYIVAMTSFGMKTSVASAAACAALAIFSWAGSTQDSIDQWLKESAPATAPADKTASAEQDNPPAVTSAVPDFALPGAIEMSDGSVLAGHVATTGDGPLNVWVESERRWRIVPPAAVLGMSAKIVKEEMFAQWRLKGVGEPEKVFTGKAYPLRQLEWTLVLADGSTMTGVIKGQPLYVYPATGGDFKTVILPDRQKGNIGQKLTDLVYPKTIIFSRKAIN